MISIFLFPKLEPLSISRLHFFLRLLADSFWSCLKNFRNLFPRIGDLRLRNFLRRSDGILTFLQELGRWPIPTQPCEHDGSSYQFSQSRSHLYPTTLSITSMLAFYKLYPKIFALSFLVRTSKTLFHSMGNLEGWSPEGSTNNHTPCTLLFHVPIRGMTLRTHCWKLLFSWNPFVIASLAFVCVNLNRFHVG